MDSWTWLAPFRCRTEDLVERAAGLLGRRVRVNSIPKGLLSFVLAIRRRVLGPGFSPDVVEVITANTRLDSRAAASELGIQLTGIDEMIKKSYSSQRKNESGQPSRYIGARFEPEKSQALAAAFAVTDYARLLRLSL